MLLIAKSIRELGEVVVLLEKTAPVEAEAAWRFPVHQQDPLWHRETTNLAETKPNFVADWFRFRGLKCHTLIFQGNTPVLAQSYQQGQFPDGRTLMRDRGELLQLTVVDPEKLRNSMNNPNRTWCCLPQNTFARHLLQSRRK